MIVSDFDMSFGSMVGFMVKWALASIPALLILCLVVGIALAILTAVCGLPLGASR